MNNFNKYFGLMILIAGGFLAFILLVVLIFYILKLFSVTFIHIPGFDNFFHFIIITIPYLIFFSGYYYLNKKVARSESMGSRFIARFFLLAGSILCFASLLLSLVKFFGVRSEWLSLFDENVHYALILHILILFATAAIIASGDPKEKDWMDRATR